MFIKFNIESWSIADQLIAINLISSHNKTVNERLERAIASVKQLLEAPVVSSVQKKSEKVTVSTPNSQSMPKHSKTSLYLSLIKEGTDLEEVLNLLDTEEDSTLIYQNILLYFSDAIRNFKALNTEAGEAIFNNDILIAELMMRKISDHLHEINEDKEFESMNLPKYEICFYRSLAGVNVAKNELMKLPKEALSDFQTILLDLKEDKIRKFRKLLPPLHGCFEAKEYQARVFFTLVNKKLIILGSCVKKCQRGSILYTSIEERINYVRSNSYLDVLESLDLSKELATFEELLEDLESQKRMVF